MVFFRLQNHRCGTCCRSLITGPTPIWQIHCAICLSLFVIGQWRSRNLIHAVNSQIYINLPHTLFSKGVIKYPNTVFVQGSRPSFPFLSGCRSLKDLLHTSTFTSVEFQVHGSVRHPRRVKLCCILVHQMGVLSAAWTTKVLDLKSETDICVRKMMTRTEFNAFYQAKYSTVLTLQFTVNPFCENPLRPTLGKPF